MSKCKPSKYAVIAANRIDTSHGFRCAKHGVTKRYSTAEIRDERMAEHQKSAKKS